MGKCPPKELILNRHTVFVCVAERTVFVALIHYHQFDIEVTYPLYLTLKYEEVEKGSTKRNH